MTDRAALGAEVRLRQLEAFQAVAQTGSYTRAADLLGISQPAVSRLVHSLSAATGLTLFNRAAGVAEPTPEARLLLAEAGRVLETVAGFEQLHRDILEQRAGQLHIACLPGFATTHLPGVLADFLRSRPQVQVTLEPDRPERILDWIIADNCDVGLTSDFPGHPAVHARRIPVRTVCILPPGHPLAAQDEIVPADLRHERLIHTKPDDPFFQSVQAAFQQCGVTPATGVETRQFGAACRLVAEGFGVSIVSVLDAQEFARTGIVSRPFFPRVHHNLDVLHSRLSRSSMIGLEFIDAFVASLSHARADPA
ncbi:LysR substrate-binding domain-containing protein [Roseovarius salinarum]|uniref:LysR substrate-binding domain-containing protein n=1 Tax=Roseovarius salinarum TaxID=1981892 RepID=UPI000C34A0D5|nr:LysR substrate-binding domain-containing protein [Roseovarius salinarum]